MEPLTPTLHLSDMTGAIPGYTEGVARVFKALALGINLLSKKYKKLETSAPKPHSAAGVKKGIPYFLRYVPEDVLRAPVLALFIIFLSLFQVMVC